MGDVMKPELVVIEGRSYRVNDPSIDMSAFQEYDLYENEIASNMGDDIDEDDFEVTMIDNNRYSTNFHVSKHYMGYIIGKKGATKSRIERDTKTEIKIPRQGQTGDIVIFGPDASNVKTARRRINMIVVSSRMKQRPTHFLSIPMNHPDIKMNFENFKESILSDCSIRGLEESLFIEAQKLHITIGVLSLMDNEERMFASKLLTEAKDKVIMPLLQNNSTIKIRLKGLSYMNDDPKNIHVLYGLIEEEDPKGLLQKLTDEVVQYFSRAGYMNDKEYGRDHVKLHVTLINSRYRNRTSETNNENKSPHGSPWKSRESFDGSGILEKYIDYDFGVTELNEIHLSCMQSQTVGPDGYYLSTCVISCKKVNE